MNFIKSYFKSTAVFLLAGFSVLGVYAALSTVSSGDPLTASGWNEIVGKLTSLNTNSDDLVTKSYVDSQISANGGGVSFAGYTTATYNGNMGGIKGMNQKCNAQYTGSRVCGYDDVVQLGVDYPWTENVWISGAFIGTQSDGSKEHYSYYYSKDGSSINTYTSYNPVCNGFSSNAGHNYGTIFYTSGITAFVDCDRNFKLACCNG